MSENHVLLVIAEAMDYPCSNMKEFETIVGVTKALLQQLAGKAAAMKVQRIDEGGIDGDLCAVVTAGDKQAVAVVWPTAEKLKQIKQLAEVSRSIPPGRPGLMGPGLDSQPSQVQQSAQQRLRYTVLGPVIY
jgi:hypothetical protein